MLARINTGITIGITMMVMSEEPQPKPARGRDAVAIVLAVGIATAINLITFAVLYDALFSEGPGLSENATQVLVTAFGGIIGVLGSYIGFRAGAAQRERNTGADDV
jgi:multisubunit Na+/H+ antiporter MnhB subunit